MDEAIKRLDREFTILGEAVLLNCSNSGIAQLDKLRTRINDVKSLCNKIEESQKKRESVLDRKLKLLSDLISKVEYMNKHKPDGVSFPSITSLLERHKKVSDDQMIKPCDDDYDDDIDCSPKVYLNVNDDIVTPGLSRNARDKSPCGLLAQPLSPYQHDETIEYVLDDEFQIVPQYMKGRMKLEMINEFVDSINSVLSTKYNYLKQPRSKLKGNELIYNLFGKWKQQLLETNSDYFCTEEDFLKLNNIKLSKKENNIITILRHLKRLRQVRIKNCVYYIVHN